MKKSFKTVLAIAMAITMLFTLAVVSFAADNTQTLDENNKSGNATVWYQTDKNNTIDPDDEVIDDANVDDNYTVTIPVRVLATKSDATAVTYDVTASDVLIHFGKKLQVSCAYAGALKLKDNTETTLAYAMAVDGTGFSTGDVILEAAAGAPTTPVTVAINAALTAAPLFAGVYEDTCTFTCAVVDAA